MGISNEKDYIIRYAKTKDVEEVKALLQSAFGEMTENAGGFENMTKCRYLIAIDKATNKLAAVTGLVHDEKTDSMHISWTTTHPDFRHKGIMQMLFKRLTEVTDEDIYCYCWKLQGKDRVNLQTLMDLFGFELHQSGVEKHALPGDCPSPQGCPYKKDVCSCSQDIYVRKSRS